VLRAVLSGIYLFDDLAVYELPEGRGLWSINVTHTQAAMNYATQTYDAGAYN